jgi:hypothetical protein
MANFFMVSPFFEGPEGPLALFAKRKKKEKKERRGKKKREKSRGIYHLQSIVGGFGTIFRPIHGRKAPESRPLPC